MYKFNMTPQTVPLKNTKNIIIKTKIPSPETMSIINGCLKNEPSSMNNQLPVAWHNAVDYQVFDKSGNCFIDFTSGIFVANVGHSNPKVCKAIKDTVDKQLLHSYYYPTEERFKFTEKLLSIVPKQANLNKVFLLSTGSEAVEAAIKIATIYSSKINQNKKIILSFENSFHGKTMGAQMAGGKPKEKSWIGSYNSNLINIPFPYPWILEEKKINGKDFFLQTLKKLEGDGLNLSNIAAILTEAYQGWCAIFLPEDYVKAMEEWTYDNKSLLIFDCIQSGFARTGKMFAFEHYNVNPDIICCGKGISSSLPLSAVITNEKYIEPEQSFNSTHGGNPVACAASLAALEELGDKNLVAESDRKGKLLERLLGDWKEEIEKSTKTCVEFEKTIPRFYCKGLLASVFIRDPWGYDDPGRNASFVDELIEIAMRKGLLSIRTGSGTLKLGPPLTIPDDALVEGIEILKESLLELVKVRYDT